jgi:hypothetical protein
MKTFKIVDANNVKDVTTITANNGKSALKKFLQKYAMYAGMYEIHKCKGIWVLSSTYGAYFSAIEV